MGNLDSQRLNRIKAWMQRYVDTRRYAGSSVLIREQGEEVFFHAAGQRNMAEDLPFERDTLVRIYSMTKPVTTVAAMMLAERGLFSLDTPVSEFIPGFSDMQALIPGAERIDQTERSTSPTLHQLMTHTAGLSYPFNPGVLAAAMEKEDLLFKPGQGPLIVMADRVSEFPLAFQPGSRWEYSVSIDILGAVVELVTAQRLGTFLQNEIFDPLGMSQTGFSVPKGAGDRFASLYTPLEGDAMALNAARSDGDTLKLFDEHTSSPFRYATMHSGGGGLVSTIDDYMQFAEMLRRGGTTASGERLLSASTLRFMMRNHLPGDIASMGPQSFAEQPMDGMGFGLGGAVVLDPARARTPGSVGDFSWGGMASTFFWVDPVLDLSVVFFTQLSPSSSYPSRSELKALVHGAVTR